MTSIIRADALQNLNTSNIITQTNSTTLTLGTSGQNIVIPSGVTFNTASATVTLPSTINATTINVTTVVLAAGAVGTPSLTTSGDTNTGIFFPTADTIAFTEGGAEAMRITSDSRVGIGKTSPNSIFDALYSFDYQTVTIASGATGSVKYSQNANAAGSALVIINAYNTGQGNENRGVVLFINYRNPVYPGGTVINTVSTAFADSGDNGAITSMTFAIDAANSELDITPSLRGGSGNIGVNVRFIAM